jgi:peptidoglycan/xylan/chitin deacetylase (PgdA/CDA1 family)
MDHVHLSQMTGDQALEQISQCRQSLQAVTGEPVGAFAYPYGDQNAAVRDLVRQSGYAFGVGTQRRRAVPADDIWNLPRLTVRRDDTWLHFLAKCTMR